MKRDKGAIIKRRAFIKAYFERRKLETSGISLKEIAVELSDWYIFVSPQTIMKEYHYQDK